MGAILSREKSDSKDFEKILSELDLNIRKAEGRLSEIKIRQRRTSFMWIIYSLVIWIGCVVYLFYQLNQIEVSTEKVVYSGVPVLLLPAGIYYIRRSLVWFYDQKQKKEEANLLQLRKEQKGKLEELKKKTSYYTTQSLLERYDEVLAKKKQEEAAVAAKQKEQDLRQRKPVTMPMRPMSAGPLSPNQRPFPPSQQPNGQPYPMNQQQMQQGPILPPAQPRSEPQWYDKIVDALVGDAGPETKYALICTHCFHHNGLVLKEEFDTIQYICPNCKQFNPSRKSKQISMSQQQGGHSRSHSEEVKVVNKELLAVPEEEQKEEEEKKKLCDEEAEEVLEQLQAALEKDQDTTIGARVRQRHINNEEEEQD